MFSFLNRDNFANSLESQGELRPGDSAIISDPEFNGERWFLPGVEKPAVYPTSALTFLAQGSIRLTAEGYTDEIGWPFEGTAEEFLKSIGIEPFRPEQ
jgi:hypothetical protein